MSSSHRSRRFIELVARIAINQTAERMVVGDFGEARWRAQ
jgi:hypothetical protein